MYLIVKRLFDTLLSFILLVILSPVFILIISILVVFNKTVIFYLQQRVGYKNQFFNIIKFATMHPDSMNMAGGSITLRNDPRVTKSGKILRITKMNELPQLINVLKGDMSFVGPRPLVRKGFDMYSEEVRSFIYNSVPGITGISQVVFRDEERLVSECKMDPEVYYREFIFPYKSMLEKWYINHRSIYTDIMLIFLTALKIIAPASKPEFRIFKSLPVSEHFKNKL